MYTASDSTRSQLDSPKSTPAHPPAIEYTCVSAMMEIQCVGFVYIRLMSAHAPLVM
jgi:hypothetical protein